MATLVNKIVPDLGGDQADVPIFLRLMAQESVPEELANCIVSHYTNRLFYNPNVWIAIARTRDWGAKSSHQELLSCVESWYNGKYFLSPLSIALRRYLEIPHMGTCYPFGSRRDRLYRAWSCALNGAHETRKYIDRCFGGNPDMNRNFAKFTLERIFNEPTSDESLIVYLKRAKEHIPEDRREIDKALVILEM